MKGKALIFILVFILTNISFAQSGDPNYPLLETRNGITYWGGMPITDVVGKSDLIFEGRILTDSIYFQNSGGRVCTYHNVLVLKKFKGSFISDTIKVISWDGRMILNGQKEGWPTYAHKGNEAVLFVSIMTYGNNDPSLFNIYYGPGCGFVTICDKKDVIKEVYEPIEAVIGRPYVEVRPNTCREQQEAQKKKPVPLVPMRPDGKPVTDSPSN